MNILYINHYAGSPHHGMEFRPFYLSREWVRAGHNVKIVAGTFSHVRSHQPSLDGNSIEKQTIETIDGVEYLWLPTPEYQGNGVGRVRNIWAFVRQAWMRTADFVSQFKPDIVIASSTYPMDIWVARRIAKQSKARLVFEVHDLWPLSPVEVNGMSPYHPFILLCQAAETAAYRDSDVVVSILPKVHDYMAKRGLDLNKLCIVQNGISLEDWQRGLPELDQQITSIIEAAREGGKQVVGYTGSHGLPNTLDTLLDAAKMLRDTPIKFILVGGGHEKPRLKQRVIDENLSNVHMLDPIPKDQVRSFLKAIDVAYIGWQNLPIYRFGIAPNKLMDYMAAGCTVLHSVSAGNDPVAESGCGITVPPESAEHIAQGLKSLLALTANERTLMGEKGRVHVSTHHDYKVLAKQFLDSVRPTTS